MAWVGRTKPEVRNLIMLPIQLFQSLISSWNLLLVLAIVKDVEQCIKIKLLKVWVLIKPFLSWISWFLQQFIIVSWESKKIELLLIIKVWSVSIRYFKKLNYWKLCFSFSLNRMIYLWFKTCCVIQNRSKGIWTCESIATFNYSWSILKNSL